MSKQFRFRSSLGYVYLALDLESFETEMRDGKTVVWYRTFKITSGEDLLDELYIWESAHIEKKPDGMLWFIIGLEDGSWGCGNPEYLLE